MHGLCHFCLCLQCASSGFENSQKKKKSINKPIKWTPHFLLTQNLTVSKIISLDAKKVDMSLYKSICITNSSLRTCYSSSAPIYPIFLQRKTCSVQNRVLVCLEAHDINFSQYDCHFSLSLMQFSVSCALLFLGNMSRIEIFLLLLVLFQCGAFVTTDEPIMICYY